MKEMNQETFNKMMDNYIQDLLMKATINKAQFEDGAELEIRHVMGYHGDSSICICLKPKRR